jgi:hypothetical protein
VTTPEQLAGLIAAAVRAPAASTIDEFAARAVGPVEAQVTAALRAASLGQLRQAAEAADGLLHTAEVYRLTGEAVQALAERKPDRAIERTQELADLIEDSDDAKATDAEH